MEAQVSWPAGLVFLLCFFSALPRCCRFVSGAESAAPTLVTSLPGFDGDLPFRLETGYVTVDEENGAELFYYFVESEGDPRSDPLIIWLTGGNHCSTLTALLLELGPLKFVAEPYDYDGTTIPRLEYNPYSYTKAANVLFVDWPVGAGFSFSRNPRGYDVGDMSSSLQLKIFITKWLNVHPDYLANRFYVGGDSYGGKIVPVIAQKISEDIEAGIRPTINLKGYVVGNPVTREAFDAEWRVPYLHGMGIISDQLYKTIMEHCHGEDHTNPQNMLCGQALEMFNRLLEEISLQHILYRKCAGVSLGQDRRSTERKILQQETRLLKYQPPHSLQDCLEYANYLAYAWANNKITQETLGIKKGSMGDWVRCHDGDLPYSEDIESSIMYHLNVTSKGYRALVYSGDHDAEVPFLGTQYWVRSLNFSIVNNWRAWHLDGQSSGFTISYANNITFATVKGGGHVAPAYQPERCLAMFRRWISDEPL